MLKPLALLLTALVLFACNSKPEPIADARKNDYALYDERGDFHRLSYYNDSKAIVLFVQGNGCPIVRNVLTDFHSVVADYSEKGVTFFMINSNIQDDREKIRAEATEFSFEVPVLEDSAQLIADELDITITAEAIVLDPSTREVLYRGPINDRLDYEAQKNEPENRFLREALDAILSGSAPQSREKMTRGCTVTRLSKLEEQQDALTYTEDIAPILQRNCVRCHRDGGIGPWAMTDYQTVAGWSAMMKEVLLSKRMPPWKADIQVGEFKNSFAMADSNARKLVRWIDGGLLSGTGDDPLPDLQFDDTTWEGGPPDKIVTLDTERLPATGNIAYRYQYFKLDLPEDTWLRGVEIKPGNAKVVHHIVVTNTGRNTVSPITPRKIRKWTDNYIALGGGADQSTFFPEGTGVLVPKGSELTVQIHYTTTGKEEEDQTRIGFYYHKEAPESEFYALSPSNTDFVIPPFGKNVQLFARDTVRRDIEVHYIVPHMHYRGKSIKFSVIHPDGTKKTLVSVPDFSFNWQWLYKLATPEFVPQGSIIEVEGIYDNTYQNPLNPDPEQELTFGIQSTDEMLIGFFNYTLVDRL